MTDDDRDRTEAELEREIRESRKFTPQEALARMAGPGAMKGASPVSEVEQAQIAIGNWLNTNTDDPTGSLQSVIHRSLLGSELLLNSLDQPLTALEAFCQRVLASEPRLNELVREADVEWGRRMDERPHFERDGASQHPDDPYTVASVRTVLYEIVQRLSLKGEGSGEG